MFVGCFFKHHSNLSALYLNVTAADNKNVFPFPRSREVINRYMFNLIDLYTSKIMLLLGERIWFASIRNRHNEETR